MPRIGVSRTLTAIRGIPMSTEPELSPSANPEKTPDPASRRLASIDAYRGLVMFLMMAEVLRFCAVASALPESAPDKPVWKFLCYHQSHVEWADRVWTDWALHDMIQPSFSFLVGVALVFSIASRRARGQSMGWLTAHT